MPTTTNLSITTPTVGGSTDAWGTILNAAFDTVDAVFAAAGTGVSMNIDGGQIDGITYLSIGTTPADAGAIRLPNNTSIEFRNAGDSANITAVALTSANVMEYGDVGATSFQFGGTAKNTVFPGDVEIDGVFNHDGTTFGALGKIPTTQYANINIPTLTSVWATHFADIETILGQITACLESFGFSATS